MKDKSRYLDGRIEKSGDCLIFTGRKTRDGYGAYGNGANLAHRLAYTIAYGDIPNGMTVDHICFNRPCCNPEHLRLLTRRENSKRQRSAMKTHCKHGHPFDEKNTIRRSGKDGARQCRACAYQSVYKYELKKKLLGA